MAVDSAGATIDFLLSPTRDLEAARRFLRNTETLEHVGGTTQSFIYVWVALLVMTGIEVFIAYEQVPTLIMLTALVGLSVVKAALIIAYFTHLKFEKLMLIIFMRTHCGA